MALPLSNLLQKEVEFDFEDRCKEAFDCLKRVLTTTPIIQAPDWTAPFELMCLCLWVDCQIQNLAKFMWCLLSLTSGGLGIHMSTTLFYNMVEFYIF